MGTSRDGEGLGRHLRSVLLSQYSAEQACEFGFSLLDILEYLDSSLVDAESDLGRARQFVDHLSQPCWVCLARLGELRKMGEEGARADAATEASDTLKILAKWYHQRKGAALSRPREGNGSAEKSLLPWEERALTSAATGGGAVASALKAIVDMYYPTLICQLIAREWDRLTEQYAGRTVFLWAENGELKTEIFRLGKGSQDEGAKEAKRRGLPADCLCVYFPFRSDN